MKIEQEPFRTIITLDPADRVVLRAANSPRRLLSVSCGDEGAPGPELTTEAEVVEVKGQ